MERIETMATRPLRRAGIRTDGARPFDMRIHDPRVFRRSLLHGTIGLGESYMDGDWDCGDLAGFFSRLVLNGADRGSAGFTGSAIKLFHRLYNAQDLEGARKVARDHYDLGNDLYQAMLDDRMVYTCGYYRRGARSLEEAQEHKLRLVCEKLSLKPGDRVLDIGCGFGSFAAFAAKEYGAIVTGITISVEQLALGRERTRDLSVTLLELDYRALASRFGPAAFDHVVSIGMFEAVGPKNYRAYMEAASSVLRDGGGFLLHTIGIDDPGFDPWIERYILPNGYLPSLEDIRRSSHARFRIADVHEFGQDYDPTLVEWNARFQSAWPSLKPTYGERFRRMWEYYLLQCAGIARAGATHLWQVLMYKGHLPDTLRSVR